MIGTYRLLLVYSYYLLSIVLYCVNSFVYICLYMYSGVCMRVCVCLSMVHCRWDAIIDMVELIEKEAILAPMQVVSILVLNPQLPMRVASNLIMNCFQVCFIARHAIYIT